MQAITSAVLVAFVLYVGSWYFGLVEGNFALLLLQEENANTATKATAKYIFSFFIFLYIVCLLTIY